ncbi:hypothetical protein TrVE_jg10509 [Triparma verrucosa]|uniref:Uncharacterized protein n=1 Tax=Triparma verrucosa TaxID=1606542 RepID=A0A9W7KWY7_9STRA|nr:hypothetical protein TrVE_jg10509 [Triparma verrucosa]
MSSPSHSSPHLVTPQYNPLNSFGLCVILSLLTSSNAIVQNLSKDPVTHVYPYDPTSLPLGSEILKLAIALAYVRIEKDTSNNKRPRKSSSHVSLPNAHPKQQSPLEVTYHSIVYLLPSLLYFMKNTSDTISLQHLQPPTFQVYSNLKIVFTAVLSRLYFTRPCSDARWAYLLFLSIGAR